MRGEYWIVVHAWAESSELPPRARRIRKALGVGHDFNGTTSACAENTNPNRQKSRANGNYLRVRGEYAPGPPPVPMRPELPPRARRILVAHYHPGRRFGTTSACAENTPAWYSCSVSIRNYLRVRGEYATSTSRKSAKAELPPRARRIPVLGDKRSFYGGTTSACAENTLRNSVNSPHSRNYLRVRGEYCGGDHFISGKGELPPRARRIHVQKRSNFLISGTTSACAENTRILGPVVSGCWNYLRVRGEYLPVV